jgi:hypothetical protein
LEKDHTTYALDDQSSIFPGHTENSWGMASRQLLGVHFHVNASLDTNKMVAGHKND